MSEITKIPSENALESDRTIWIILAALTVFVYFFGLTIPLVGPDEPRYAEVAREMFERGDWITPTLGGFNWFEKPALLYWLQIASYRIFGVSEFAARFGSTLFGFGTVASLWILGRSLDLRPPRQGARAFADWLALIAASTIGLIVFSRAASFDIVLTFPMTASLVGFFVFESAAPRSSRSRAWLGLFAFYFFIGAALLAKGLVGIVFPVSIVAFYYVLSWKMPGRKFFYGLVWGPFVAFAVSALWYAPMYARHGYGFIDEFIVQHHFQRYTSNKYFHPQPFHFFFWVLPLMTIPWLPFFLAGIWRFVKEGLNPGDSETRSGGVGSEGAKQFAALQRFAASWILIPLVFFSFSGSKLPGYILPAVPAATIFAAVSVWRFVDANRGRRLMVQALAAVTFMVVIGLLAFVVPRFADRDSVKVLLAAASERGFSNASVLGLHTISHNAEFYAAGRIVRDADGKQRKFLGPLDVLEEVRRQSGQTVLVLVPLEYVKQLTENERLRSEVLKDNGELAIVAVREDDDQAAALRILSINAAPIPLSFTASQ
jgi:4-amino-4-deoxy-L-arabinose transferase-like glycosyltransferase